MNTVGKTALDAGIARDTASTGGYVGACVMDWGCLEYTSAPADQYARLESQCASVYAGSWRTSPRCSGTWCGICSLSVPGMYTYASYYTLCTADLASACQDLGGVFTTP